MTTHASGQPTPDTLPLYLKDRVFVEYFNSFLMLPAFSSKLYFNVETHNFESVQTLDGSIKEKMAEGGAGRIRSGLLASPSLETLYLTDDAMGQVLDPRQSWLWVIQHRLPLFIRSDLYAEYKLSQILLNSCSHFIKQHLRNLRSSIVADLDKSHREKRKRSAMSGRLVRRSTSIGLSTTPALSQRPHSSRPHSGSQLMKEEERILTLCSKSGMGLFRKFLDGKHGEKNWLFWMDAEQMAHLNQHDLTRHLNVVQERFLRPGGSLELSSVLKADSNAAVGARLTPAIVKKIQSEVEEGLKTYWYPRFLVHYLSSKQAPKTTSSIDPSLSLPALNKEVSNQQLCWEKCNKVRHPSKSATPTFRRLHVPVERSRRLQRAQTVSQLTFDPSSSSPRAETSGRLAKPAALFTPAMTRSQAVPAMVNSSTGSSLDFSVRCRQSLSLSRNETAGTPTSTSNTRLLWTRDSHRQDSGHTMARIGEYVERPSSSAEHFSKLAKYCKYPVIVSGRPATVHGHTKSPHLPPPASCTSCCQILSVSGTPVHYGATEHEANRQDQYLTLLRCLTIEHRKAGGYFQQYLESLPNQVPLRCLLLWRDVQEYKALFVGDGFSPSLVEMKAKMLYSCYIVEGSPSFISCPINVSAAISRELWPAFEDLFDSAEEYVLGELMSQWLELCELEQQRFEKIQCATDLSKSLVTVEEELSVLYDEGCFDSPFKKYFHHSTFSSTSSSSSLSDSFTSIPSRIASQASLNQVDECQTDDDDEANREKSLNRRNEEVLKVVSMADILKNPKELEHFKLFLNDNMAAIDLLCWMDIESFRALPVGDKVLRNVKAKHLKTTYFNNKYFFGPNSPANKEAWRQVISAGGSQRVSNRPKSPFFREAQKHIRARLEKKWVPTFISTAEYLERNVLGSDETGTSSKNRDRKRSDGNQFTASRDSILLRKLLHEQARRDVFRQYITVQAAEGTHPSKNMEFWLEVQRFKEMFHSHMNVALLRKKLNAVITCYLTPSKIEVDVPFSEADVIAKKPFGPYIFREAQATVFRLLLGYWQEYQSFSSDHTEQELFAAIDQLKREIEAQRNSVRQQEILMKREEDEKKQSVMRFETEVERKSRLAHERERREFGDVAVEFRLSCPQPQFDYCGRIAELLQYESFTDDNLGSTIGNKKGESQLSCQTKKPPGDKHHGKTKSSPSLKTSLLSRQDTESLQVRFADHSPHVGVDSSLVNRAHTRRHTYNSKRECSVFFYS